MEMIVWCLATNEKWKQTPSTWSTDYSNHFVACSLIIPWYGGDMAFSSAALGPPTTTSRVNGPNFALFTGISNRVEGLDGLAFHVDC